MPDNGKPYTPHLLFSKVHEAREALRLRANEIINELMDVAKQAKASGDYESASKTLMWLVEHMPAANDGTRLVDHSPDKAPPVTQQQDTRPSISIGIALGGLGNPKELPPAEVIEVKPSGKRLLP